MSLLFASGEHGIEGSASASLLPMNIQGSFPLGLTGFISSQTKGLTEFSPAPQLESVNSLALSLPYGPALTSIYDYWKTIDLTVQTVVKVMSLLFNRLSRFAIAFLPRSPRSLLILWLQSPSAVILEPKKIKSVTVSILSPSICHKVMGLDAMIFVFWMLSFKPAFSLYSFTLIKRLFSSSSLPTIRVVSSAYLRLLIFLQAILTTVCASSSPTFRMMYSA